MSALLTGLVSPLIAISSSKWLGTWEQLAKARKHQLEKIVVDQDYAAPKDNEGLALRV